MHKPSEMEKELTKAGFEILAEAIADEILKTGVIRGREKRDIKESTKSERMA